MNIDFNSKKFLLLLIVVCVVFFVLVIKAFEYIPDSENPINTVQHADNINQPNEEEPKEADNGKDIQEKKSEKIRLYSANSSYSDVPEMEEIDAPPGVTPEVSKTVEKATTNSEITDEEKIYISLGKAQKLRKEGKLSEALAEYNSVISLTQDKSIQAASYEGIATLYAASRKYGTALSYATKAYNIFPSSSREILLARLYYKTGDMDKATKRVNNVLHREFTEDR